MKRSMLALLAGGVLIAPALFAAPNAPEPPMPADVVAPAVAKDHKPDRIDSVLDAFVASLDKNAAYSAEARDTVKSLVAAQRADADRRATTITDVLAATNAEYRKALEALAEENIKDSVVALEKLAADADQFVAAEATFFLARAHMMEERAEAAMPLLTKLTGDMAKHSLYAGESQYLLAAAQAALLKRTDAAASFEKFLKDNPDASERLRVGAMRLAEELKFLASKEAEGKLPDVHDRMGFSRRKLNIEDSGNTTRKEQDNIIAMLDVLIKEAEECEGKGCCSCNGNGKGKGKGRGGKGGVNPGAGAQASKAPIGTSNVGAQNGKRGGKDGWDVMRNRDREKVLAGLKGNVPDRYKELVERYYKNLEEEENKN